MNALFPNEGYEFGRGVAGMELDLVHSWDNLGNSASVNNLLKEWKSKENEKNVPLSLDSPGASQGVRFESWKHQCSSPFRSPPASASQTMCPGNPSFPPPSFRRSDHGSWASGSGTGLHSLHREPSDSHQ